MRELLGLNEFASVLNSSDCAIGNTNKSTLELAAYAVKNAVGDFEIGEKLDTRHIQASVNETLNLFNGRVLFSMALAKNIASSIIDVCFVSERSYVKIWEVTSTLIKHSAKELEKEMDDFEMSEGMYLQLANLIGDVIKEQKAQDYNLPAYFKVYTGTSSLSAEKDKVEAILEEWSFSGATTATMRNIGHLVNKIQSESYEVLKARTLDLHSQMSRDVLLKLIFNEEVAKDIEKYYSK